MNKNAAAGGSGGPSFKGDAGGEEGERRANQAGAADPCGNRCIMLLSQAVEARRKPVWLRLESGVVWVRAATR